MHLLNSPVEVKRKLTPCFSLGRRDAHICASQSITLHKRYSPDATMGGRYECRARPHVAPKGLSRALQFSNRNMVHTELS